MQRWGRLPLPPFVRLNPSPTGNGDLAATRARPQRRCRQKRHILPSSGSGKSTLPWAGKSEWRPFNDHGRQEKPTTSLRDELERHISSLVSSERKAIIYLDPLTHTLDFPSGQLAAQASDYSKHLSRQLQRAKTDNDVIAHALGQEWDTSRLSAAHSNGDQYAIRRCVHAAFLRWLVATRAKPTDSPSSPIARLAQIIRVCDLTHLGEEYPSARVKPRKIICHVGPTNSGKTYHALAALARAPSGIYAGPLRLLAHEIFTRFNAGDVPGLDGRPRPCNLLTGEERRIVDESGTLTSCTVEMMPVDTTFDVAVIDEIQMIADPDRGQAWSHALIGTCAKEVHVCGEDTVVDLIRRIAAETGDEVEIHRYERLSPLVVADRGLGGDLGKVRKGDCVVTFARTSIFDIKRAIEARTGLSVAVAYGALPPEVREQQARRFNEGDGFDVMVASDAIGMGLNLKIRRIIFETLQKFDGREFNALEVRQIKQIAGRAGRYRPLSPSSPSAMDVGEVTTLDNHDLPFLRMAMSEPLHPIESASVEPPWQVPFTATLLAHPEASSAEIRVLVASLARTAPHFSIQVSAQRLLQSSLVAQHRRNLVWNEVETFSLAPTNPKQPFLHNAFVEMIDARAGDRAFNLAVYMNKCGLTKLIDSLSAAERQQSHPDGAERVHPPNSYERDLTRSVLFTTTNLVKLELTHKMLTLYLWLSFRFAMTFPDRLSAQETRTRVESLINFVLANMKAERWNPNHTQAQA